jgi:hypothetical protein
MVRAIKKGTDKIQLEKALANLKNAKKFDAYKYCDVITLKEYPLDNQRSLRDKWL